MTRNEKRAVAIFLCTFAVFGAPPLACSHGGTKGSTPASPDTPLARVAGTDIGNAALDNTEEVRTLEQSLLKARVGGVGRAIEQELLQDEAKKKGKTAQDLLSEMMKGIEDPSEQEVSSALADPTNTWRLESLLKMASSEGEKKEREAKFKEDLKDALKKRKFADARQSLIESLWKEAKIELFLDRLLPPRLDLPADDPAALGPAQAPVTLTAFVDFQAPSCKNAESLYPAIRRMFGDKVRIAYRHFPSPMRPLATRAAETSSCAAAQGKFLAYKDLLFSKPTLKAEDLDAFVVSATLDKSAFDGCLSRGEGKKMVEADGALARKLSVRTVPAFFVNGIPVWSMPSPLDLRVLIEAELRRKT